MVQVMSFQWSRLRIYSWLKDDRFKHTIRRADMRNIEGRFPIRITFVHVARFLRESLAWASCKIALRSFGVEERYTYRRNLVRANFVQKWIIEPITDFVLLVNSRLMRYERNVTRFRDRDIIYSPYRWNSYFVIARSIISDLLGGEGKHDPIRIPALLP